MGFPLFRTYMKPSPARRRSMVRSPGVTRVRPAAAERRAIRLLLALTLDAAGRRGAGRCSPEIPVLPASAILPCLRLQQGNAAALVRFSRGSMIGVGGVAQPIAHEVEGEDDQDHRRNGGEQPG